MKLTVSKCEAEQRLKSASFKFVAHIKMYPKGKSQYVNQNLG